jgi:glutathione synthase/RimK-type ligase-like ATP-grasp enzyme
MIKKRLLITVNPGIIRERSFTTMRKFITVVDQYFDLLLLPIDGYDFKRGRVRAFKRLKGGAFENVGAIQPAGDLWLIYSDGYYLNHRRFGFRLRRDYFNAQIDFHQQQLNGGSVSLMLNSPESEVRTLKSWFATLDNRRVPIIPTHVFPCIDEVYDFQKQQQRIVVKPIWGGASTEVELLADEKAVRKFHHKLKRHSDRDLSDYCFQAFCRGDEKRLWFVGGQFVAGRKYRGRETPWEEWNEKCRLSAYHKSSHRGFTKDLNAAQSLYKLSGLSVGAIDFIGDRINEINGGGAVMTTMDERRVFIDTRPAFIDYLLKLMSSL